MLTYKNILFLENTKQNFLITSLWLKKGSFFDPVGKEGLSHLFEHLFLRRNLKHQRYEDFMEYLNTNLLNYNAYTDKEYIFFYFLHTINEQKLATAILTEAFENPLFTETDLENEKLIIFNEQDIANQNNTILLNRLADKGVWINPEMVHEILGTRKSVEKIRFRDFLNFAQKKESDFELCLNKKRFIKLENKINNILIAVTIPFVDSLQPLEVVALDFISSYLGSGWSSRLIKELRIKNKLTYWINPSNDFYSKGGYIRFSYTMSSKEINKSIIIIQNELNSLKEKIIKEDIFELQKNIFKNKLFQNQLINNYLFIRWFGKRKLYFGIESIDNYFKILSNLDNKFILSVAIKYLDKVFVALMGNRELIENFIE